MNLSIMPKLKPPYNSALNSAVGALKLWPIEVRLFYLYRRDFKNVKNLNIKPEIYPLTFQSIEAADIKSIAMRFENYFSEKKMLRMLSNDYSCLGLRNNNKIIALKWYNFKKCDSKLLSFLLNKNEVYMTGAITSKEYRGKNVAPYFSCQIYEYFHNLGRTIFYSIVHYHNLSAIRFHRKFKDRPFKLYLYIELFKKYRMRFPLKCYKR